MPGIVPPPPGGAPPILIIVAPPAPTRPPPPAEPVPKVLPAIPPLPALPALLLLHDVTTGATTRNATTVAGRKIAVGIKDSGQCVHSARALRPRRRLAWTGYQSIGVPRRPIHPPRH